MATTTSIGPIDVGGIKVIPANPPAIPIDEAGSVITWNLTGGNAETDFVNVQPNAPFQGGFNWYNTAVDVAPDPHADAIMTLDGFGNLFAGASVTVPGVRLLSSNRSTIPVDAYATLITQNFTDGFAETDFINVQPDAPFRGGFNWYNTPAGTVPDSRADAIMTLDGFGSLSLKGDITTEGNLTTAGNLAVGGNLTVEGDTNLDGIVTLGQDPTQPMEAATKQYVDTHGGGGGGGDMVYPAAGVPQSTGAAWGASIPAANLARTDAANTFAAAQTFNSTVTLAADPTTNLQAATKEYVDNHSSMIYPAAGVPQSDGAAWGASIPAANLAYRNQANTFTAAQIFNSTVTLAADPTTNLQAATKQYVDNKAAVYPAAGVAVSTGTAWGTPIDPATLPRLNVANTFTADQTINGHLRTTSDVMVGSTSFLRASGDLACSINGNVQMAWAGAGTYSNITLNGSNANGTRMGFCGGPEDKVMYLDVPGGGAFNFRLNNVGFITFSGAGDATFFGTVTAGTKSFRIPYPLTKDSANPDVTLTHSCLEGPEIGVYYRGEAETSNGVALVTLPEYFEALTMDENRSVLLTQMYDEDEAEPAFAMLMSSQVRGGQFTIRSSTPTAKVAWEVKAVRADVPPLVVVAPYVPPPSMDAGKQTEPTPQPQPRRRR